MAFDKEPILSPISEASKLEDSSATSGSQTPPTPPTKHRPPPIQTPKLEISRWSDGSGTPQTPYENPRTPPSSPPTSTKSRPKSWIWHFVTLFLSFLWLPFIITLLVLNFESHILGASVWCPFGHCASNAFNAHAIATAVHLDEQDHNVEAALQYVAQIFEIWFLIISTSFLYDVGMLFARSPQGLPVGFMLTHLEIENPKNLVNPLLWTTAFSSKGSSREDRKRRNTIKLFLFALLAALLTILVNLMGAATAVLLLPSLSWVKTDKIPQHRFDGIALAQGPIGDNVFPGICSAAQLQAGNYSCTSPLYGPSLDQWAATAQSTLQQYAQPNGTVILGTSQEAAVQFALNVSSDTDLAWIASRQVLRDMSGDYLEATGQSANRLSAVEDTDDDDGDDDDVGDPRFSRSLQTLLLRTGPALGLQASCNVGNVSVTTVSADKEVHCYSNWASNDESNYTKCFPIGTGFSPSNRISTFHLEPSQPSSTPGASITTSFSTLSTYYNATTAFSSSLVPCLSNPSPSCNWTAIFNSPLPLLLANTSTNILVTSYTIPSSPNSADRIWCEAQTYLTFPTYTLDTSASSNPLHLVQLDNLVASSSSSSSSVENSQNEPMIVHPDWLLAAFSVDTNGTIPTSRLAAGGLQTAISAFGSAQTEVNALEFAFFYIYALGQGMSMVNYNFTPPSSSSNPSPSSSTSRTHPLLTTSANLHLWSWGLEARTSKVGVATTIAGCVVVIARIILGLGWPRRRHGAVEVLVGALEFRDFEEGVERGRRGGRGGAFLGLRRGRERARVGFGILDGEGRVGVGVVRRG